ncbi:MAG: 16S rRNA (cytosine(967)-C(5))-methyltransferase RsmB [Deltaproteobacteria bacterium]|nr:16S rRNA (cytosine(967)-C(5))-methyltransferase RsmB [Deltaproteobacteria bacterium]
MRRGVSGARAGAARGWPPDGLLGVCAGAPRAKGGSAITVREKALAILSRVDRGGAYADILLDRALGGKDFPDPRDRGLLTELVMGTLRRRGTLDLSFSPFLSRPIEKTDAVVRNALRLGAYQLIFTRIPERVALFETVACVKRVRGEKPAGLVNAVLRAVVRAGKSPILPQDGLPRKAAELSVPLHLLTALIRSLGEEEAFAFLASSLEKPPFVVRANRFRSSREALLSRLSAAGMEPRPCRYAEDGIIIGKPGLVHADRGFRSGDYLVMDEGAQLIAPLLSPREGESVLDACAAPGGKATHLAALCMGKAGIVAADASAAREKTLRDTASRLGATGMTTAVHDFSKGPLPGFEEKFDRVLVDAPCTGMGVIRRNPDAKWRFRPDDPERMAGLQRSILRGAFASLAPGGILLYSTCSPLRQENEEVVKAFREETGAAILGREAAGNWPGPPDAWTPEGFVRLVPHRHGTDGFFAALLRKG